MYLVQTTKLAEAAAAYFFLAVRDVDEEKGIRKMGGLVLFFAPATPHCCCTRELLWFLHLWEIRLCGCDVI